MTSGFKEVIEGVFELKNHKNNHGKRLVIVAGIHGDEPQGVAAIESLMATKIELKKLRSILLVLANPEALKKGIRAVDVDLNRLWENNSSLKNLETYEQKRRLELTPFLFQPNTILLDLHTCSGTHKPFVLIDKPLNQEVLSILKSVPIKYISYNWEHFIGPQTLSGSLNGSDPQSTAIAVECGQHADPSSGEMAKKVSFAILEYLNQSEARPENGVVNTWLKVIKSISFPGMKWEWHQKGEGPLKISQGQILGSVNEAPYFSPIDGYLILPNQKLSEINPEVGFLAIEKTPDSCSEPCFLQP